jgi:drug/metabolite transporter (DMT)-like permease
MEDDMDTAKHRVIGKPTEGVLHDLLQISSANGAGSDAETGFGDDGSHSSQTDKDATPDMTVVNVGSATRQSTLVPYIASLRSVFLTFLACFTFMLVGPALMMLNKYIMEDLHFNHPISLCNFGVVGSIFVAKLAVTTGIGEIREESRRVVAGKAWFWVALPIGLAKALSMSSGNAVYLHLSFGFIQMLKAFTPFIVLIVMRCTDTKMPPRAAVWCVGAIVVGTLVQVKSELHATFIGLILALSSQSLEAVSVVLTQKILQQHKFSVLEGMYLTAPPAGLALFVGGALLEGQAMIEAGHHFIPFEHPTVFFFSAALGVGINFISFLVMRLTSALTMKILNTVRSIGLVIIGVVFYGEYHSPKQLFGYSVAIMGFAGYNLFQMFPDAARTVENNIVSQIQRFGGCCLDPDAGGSAKPVNDAARSDSDI